MARTLRLDSEAEIAGKLLDKERFCSALRFLREFHMSSAFARTQLQGIVRLIHPLSAPNNIIEARYCQSTLYNRWPGTPSIIVDRVERTCEKTPVSPQLHFDINPNLTSGDRLLKVGGALRALKGKIATT